MNTLGNKWLYDGLPWSGQADFRTAMWRPLENVSALGEWKASKDRRLAFIAVDRAGHGVPGDVREGSYKIAQRWIKGGWKN